MMIENNPLHNALNLSQTATKQLQTLLETLTPEQITPQLIAETETLFKQALANLAAALNPPNLDHIPPDVLSQAESLGIPLNDIEVQVAMSCHHLSQIIGVLAEIDNWAETIRRRREYFLVRLPDMTVEKLGSRLPVMTAADLQGPTEQTPASVRDALKAKYNLNRLNHKTRSQSSLFEKIKQAKQALEPPEVALDEEDDLPF
ncbi:hypothetical protein VB834_13315 [Limnoraphis robusta Tam1]|uniref:hypothetical protein n=1 Tax=Limnoraphis robusta TaxID=1118279 RepID=UPI002B2118E5|nr:hypothetical protein [Limnoraphis robusta]MEA5540008.1 hypothetical protein [Limnoraphis robusta Tam1]